MKKSKLVAVLLVVVMVFSVSPAFAGATGLVGTNEIFRPLPDGGYERSTETTIKPSVSGAEVGAIAGAAGGAAIGSFIPIVGTAAGAAIGAIAGGIAGWIYGPAD